jgi:hypothetical protein
MGIQSIEDENMTDTLVASRRRPESSLVDPRRLTNLLDLF